MKVNVRKVRNGHFVSSCEKCTETAALEKVGGIWMCNLCKSTYLNSLKAPAQVKEIEKQQSRFAEMVNI